MGGAVSPVSRRTGRRYAAGSVTKFDGYPKVCAGCGLPVRITGTVALWFETGRDRVKRSFHFDCYPRKVHGQA